MNLNELDCDLSLLIKTGIGLDNELVDDEYFLK